MSTSTDHAIDHCQQRDEIRDHAHENPEFNVSEAILERADRIVRDVYAGKRSQPHKLAGIEIMAQAVARHVLEEGAERVARDVDVNLRRLKELAASEHISSC